MTSDTERLEALKELYTYSAALYDQAISGASPLERVGAVIPASLPPKLDAALKRARAAIDLEAHDRVVSAVAAVHKATVRRHLDVCGQVSLPPRGGLRRGAAVTTDRY